MNEVNSELSNVSPEFWNSPELLGIARLKKARSSLPVNHPPS